MPAYGVPVKINGISVGSARVNDDGTIDLIMHSPNEAGKEILQLITAGLLDGLSIQPYSIPAVPTESERIKVRNDILNALLPACESCGRKTRRLDSFVRVCDGCLDPVLACKCPKLTP